MFLMVDIRLVLSVADVPFHQAYLVYTPSEPGSTHHVLLLMNYSKGLYFEAM